MVNEEKVWVQVRAYSELFYKRTHANKTYNQENHLKILNKSYCKH